MFDSARSHNLVRLAMATAGVLILTLIMVIKMLTRSIAQSDDYVIRPEDSRHHYCAHLHGKDSGAKSCPASLYKRNKEGSSFGNCGWFGSTVFKCLTDPDYLCGALHCQLPQETSTDSQHFIRLQSRYINFSNISIERSDDNLSCFVVTVAASFSDNEYNATSDSSYSHYETNYEVKYDAIHDQLDTNRGDERRSNNN